MAENKRTLVYLITGGCGFLGKHLLDVLLEKEEKLAEVRVFDKHTYPGFHEQRKTGKNRVFSFLSVAAMLFETLEVLRFSPLAFTM